MSATKGIIRDNLDTKPAAPGKGSATPTGPVAPSVPSAPIAPIAIAAGILIAAATIAAFWPSAGAKFISWDDPDYMYFVWDHTNPNGVVPKADSLYKDAKGLREIWNPFSKRIQQFYPLVFSTYWIEYQFWGLNPRGYHVVNIAQHVVNAILVMLLFLRFGVSVWVAAFAAAVFALHPAQVASVVWVTERKNTLSTLFYLLAFLAFVHFRQQRGVAPVVTVIHGKGGSRRQMQMPTPDLWGFDHPLYYIIMLACYVAALLSKTQTLTLPLTFLLTDVILQRLKRVTPVPFAAKLLMIAPMLVLSVVAAMLTRLVEYSKNENLVRSTIGERLFIVPSSAMHYLKTFLWPVDLAPIYDRWDISPPGNWAWASLIAIPFLAAGVFVLWRSRKLPELTLWGIVQFFLVLLPVLGFIHFNYQQYTWAADHYLYLASMAGALAIGVVGERIIKVTGQTIPIASLAIAALAFCGYRTYRETAYWQNTETFWTRAIELNPNCYPANLNLGNHYARTGQPDKAMPLYKAAMEIHPITASAYEFYIQHLSRAQGPQALMECHQNRLKLAREAEAANRIDEAYRRYFSVQRLLPAGHPLKAEAAAGVGRTKGRGRS